MKWEKSTFSLVLAIKGTLQSILTQCVLLLCHLISAIRSQKWHGNDRTSKYGIMHSLLWCSWACLTIPSEDECSRRSTTFADSLTILKTFFVTFFFYGETTFRMEFGLLSFRCEIRLRWSPEPCCMWQRWQNPIFSSSKSMKFNYHLSEYPPRMSPRVSERSENFIYSKCVYFCHSATEHIVYQTALWMCTPSKRERYLPHSCSAQQQRNIKKMKLCYEWNTLSISCAHNEAKS